jgi:hypothetical protein
VLLGKAWLRKGKTSSRWGRVTLMIKQDGKSILIDLKKDNISEEILTSSTSTTTSDE